MAPFLEDPRLRQRWNQISHNAEAVTENAAANIWTFQHTYITPCLGSVGDAFDSCTAVCLGDREERARRKRERERGAHRTLAEYSFDFYDDWYDDFNDDALDGGSDVGNSGAGGSGAAGTGTITSLFSRGFFGSWRGSRAEDWDRLLAGSGSVRNSSARHHDGAGHYDGDDEGGGASDADSHEGRPHTSAGAGSGEVVDQPRRKRGMSYNTHHRAHPAARGQRRKQPEGDDPTIIPSTASLGFLARLPFKIGGTLRYKPSAANLREHPNAGGRFSDSENLHTHDENEPLLGGDDDDDDYAGENSKGDQYGTATMTMARVSASTPRPWPATAGASAPTTEADVDGDGNPTTRKRSSTVGSGDTSDSYRSRGDLFPSDEEDDEDAVPLDDEFAVALGRVDDRSSGRTRFSSSSSLAGAAAGLLNSRKGKRRADTGASYASLGSMASHGSGGAGPMAVRKGVLSRSVSRTTMDSIAVSSPRSAASSIKKRLSTLSLPGESAAVAAAAVSVTPDAEYEVPAEDIADIEEHADEDAHDASALSLSQLSVDQLREEDERAAREEDAAVERRRAAAVRLARERGLEAGSSGGAEVDESEAAVLETHAPETAPETTPKTTPHAAPASPSPPSPAAPPSPPTPLVDDIALVPSPAKTEEAEPEFIPARLPRFR